MKDPLLPSGWREYPADPGSDEEDEQLQRHPAYLDALLLWTEASTYPGAPTT